MATETAVAAEPKTPAPAPEPTAAPQPKPEMPRGVVPRDAAKALFAALDAQAKEKLPSEVGEAEAKAEAEAATGAPEAPTGVSEETTGETPAEGKYPDDFRQQLKVLKNPKFEKQILDEHFGYKTAKAEVERVKAEHEPWGRLQRDLGGASVDQVRDYLQKAIEIGPTPEVLQEIKATAEGFQNLAAEFTTGTPAAFGKMAGALLQSNPKSFVDFVGFLMGNSDLVAKGLQEHVHPQLAQQFRGYRDNFLNRHNRNVIANMRNDSKEEGKEVLAEAADIIEEYLNLKGQPEPARQAPKPPDERDLELQRLREAQRRANAERIETFNDRVFQGAGAILAPEVQSFVNAHLPGLSEKARARHARDLAARTYNELLTNQFVSSRAQRINAAGRFDDQHGNALANFYIEQARRLIPTIGGRLLAEIREATEPAVQQRNQRVERQVARRDVGASGKPPGPSRADLKSVQPDRKSAQPFRAMFDLLDQQAEEGP